VVTTTWQVWLVSIAGIAGLMSVLVVAWARYRCRRAAGAFVCWLLPAGPLEVEPRFRAKRQGRWVHDVLVLYRGVTLTRSQILAVSNLTGPTLGGPSRRLGDRAVWLRLQLDDGRVYDLAARNTDLSLASGPFLAASLKGLRRWAGPRRPAGGEA
jgi:hypothetical protein